MFWLSPTAMMTQIVKALTTSSLLNNQLGNSQPENGQRTSGSNKEAGVRFLKPTLAKPVTVTVTMLGAVVSLLVSTWSYAESPRVQLSTTKGDMIIELAHDRAPRTVDNFIQYVEDGFYNGTIFHRVIEGFMIQGGGFSENFQRKVTRPAIPNEANNGMRNHQYTISMARTNAPHSATAQFFINSEDNLNLDHTAPTPRGWGYAVFGKVVEGQDVVDTISQVSTGPGGPFSRDAPREPVVIVEAKLLVPEPAEGEKLEAATKTQSMTE